MNLLMNFFPGIFALTFQGVSKDVPLDMGRSLLVSGFSILLVFMALVIILFLVKIMSAVLGLIDSDSASD